MKTYRIQFLLIGAFAICFIAVSCANKISSYDDFVIKVDSIHLPVTVAADSSFDIEFYGTVGFNGCVSFKTFDRTVRNNEITIKTIGTYSNSQVCPTVMVYLDGQKLNMTIPFPGVYNVKVVQPTGGSLSRQITVR